MHTTLSNIIGIMAAGLTTLSLIPQVIKTHKTRHTRDLSLGMLIIFVIGICFWIVYGLLIKGIPIIVGNCITLSLGVYLLIMKLLHK